MPTIAGSTSVVVPLSDYEPSVAVEVYFAEVSIETDVSVDTVVLVVALLFAADESTAGLLSTYILSVVGILFDVALSDVELLFDVLLSLIDVLFEVDVLSAEVLFITVVLDVASLFVVEVFFPELLELFVCAVFVVELLAVLSVDFDTPL